MNTDPGEIKENFQLEYNQLYTRVKESEDDVLLSYFGQLDQSLTYILSSKVETIIEAQGASRGVVKRIFNILIESLQNVRLHSFRSPVKQELVGIMVIKQKENFKVVVMNLADENAKHILASRIGEVNALSKVELKKKYMDTMTNGVISDKGGAGLGIITIALKSDRGISCEFSEISPGLFMVQMTYLVGRSAPK